MTDEEPSNITRLPTPPPPSIPPTSEPYDEYRSARTPLIIDNGTTSLRWGFATNPMPRHGTNAIAKFKERRTNRPLILFGDAIEAESGAKSQTRTPWEGDVLLNFDALENALDYAFVNLGIDTPAIDHPVLMTERLCTPLHSRALTSELMFELYTVPSVAYCVDGLMSFHQNASTTSGPSDGIVVSFNTASTSVIPVLNGKGIMSQAKRIPWGGSQAADYLLKLIQLKYANFPTRVTNPQSNWMLQNFCEFSLDYLGQLRLLNDPLKLRESDRIIQFPFSLPTTGEKTEEELARIAERRREQGKKLQEIAAKTRLEKLAKKEADLEYLLNMREERATTDANAWNARLQQEGFDDDASFNAMIKKLDGDVKRSQKKDADAEEPMEEPSFPLVDVPDADLDEEGIKEKKKQRLMKAGYEARERARQEKEREKAEKEMEERKEQDEREADINSWSKKLRDEQETLMTKIKDRARRKAALGDRKSAAAQARMKSIANLANDDRVPKKKRKVGGEDLFGADDADWAIYRKINTAAPSSDEEDDLERLATVESKLLAHDPTFDIHQTHAAISSQRSALLSAFRPIYDEGDVEGHARIHLNVERWRVCETWFSPGMAGVDSAGIGEVIQSILSRFSDSEKSRLVNNVFLTGGPSQLKGLAPRLHASLRPVLPTEMPIRIVQAKDVTFDAWHGMASFSKTPEFTNVSITKQDYEEHGGERVKRWWGGNWNASLSS